MPIWIFLLLLSLPLTACQPAHAAPASTPLPAATPPPWTPSPAYRSGLVWFYKPPLREEEWPDIAQKYSFFVLTHRDEDFRDQLGADRPALQYLLLAEIYDPGDCQAEPKGNQVAYLPGDFCRIEQEHPDWFLLDSLGRRLEDEPGYWLMDPGSPGYRAFWLERARQMQQAFGWRGLFLDNVEASLSKYESNLGLPSAYPTDESLQTAVLGFLDYLRQNGLGGAGSPLYANIISIRDPQVWPLYLQRLDGAMLENFATDWRGSALTAQEWENQMEWLRASQAQGKTLLLVAQGNQDDVERQRFAYASYLLVNEGLAFFRYTHHSLYREDWQYDLYIKSIGQPLGPPYAQGEEWVRDFSGGQVRVNPSSRQAQIIFHPEKK